MDLQHVSVTFFAASAAIIILNVFLRYRDSQKGQRAMAIVSDKVDSEPSPDMLKLCELLNEALPNSVTLPHQTQAFQQMRDVHWARQECDILPACVVQPHNTQELSRAMKIIKGEYDHLRKEQRLPKGIFGIRSGGHSSVHGAANSEGGVLIDMGLFREVSIRDKNHVIIGSGCRWKEVYETLDKEGLAVVGGRNSSVGVGGLILGGGLSFFSPRYGLVCSSIIDYEIVLADGSIVIASETSHADLWRALKGGANNFGIVTKFKAQAFPSTNIWSGWLYLPSYQYQKAIAEFYDYVNRASTKNNLSYDEYCAGPIMSFSYIPGLGLPGMAFQLVACNLVHTKEPSAKRAWPESWKSTNLSSLLRYWSTCKSRTLTSAAEELDALDPKGYRHIYTTTTVKNDHATLLDAHAAYKDAVSSLRATKIPGLVFAFVIQPLLPEWVRKGQPNPMGLHENFDDPFVVVTLAISWSRTEHDELLDQVSRQFIAAVETAAKARNAYHRWKYLNYCAGWQKPFEGYGPEEHEFLRGVSRKYDPQGVFQIACQGGFKLDMHNEN